jgi:light-regulated signal transduction histidine kinase (bacteriophytochrome)
MRQLICDLLAYSRVGSRGGEMAVVPLEAVVERTVVSLQRLFDETGTELTWGRLPEIVTDPGQIGVVLQNLLTNAVKFRSDLPPVLRIDAEHDAAGMWVISVTDNGIGIDPAQGERIFEMVQRLHERDRYEGSGIGLAIVRKVVERHGGRVGFEPAPGGGARFWFTAHGPDGADTMSTAATSSAPSAR